MHLKQFKRPALLYVPFPVPAVHLPCPVLTCRTGEDSEPRQSRGFLPSFLFFLRAATSDRDVSSTSPLSWNTASVSSYQFAWATRWWVVGSTGSGTAAVSGVFLYISPLWRVPRSCWPGPGAGTSRTSPGGSAGRGNTASGRMPRSECREEQLDPLSDWELGRSQTCSLGTIFRSYTTHVLLDHILILTWFFGCWM